MQQAKAAASMWMWRIILEYEGALYQVEVGLQQGSALSPYRFLILMDVLTEGVRKEVPESMMFADDISLEKEE